MRNTNILKFKKMSHDDLNEVITKSVNDFNLWVIIEALEDTSEYKLYFIEEGVNWCSISGVGTVSNDKIKECYENHQNGIIRHGYWI